MYGHIVSYAWNFGDGVSLRWLKAIVTRVYTDASSFAGTLVTDYRGLNNSTAVMVAA